MQRLVVVEYSACSCFIISLPSSDELERNFGRREAPPSQIIAKVRKKARVSRAVIDKAVVSKSSGHFWFIDGRPSVFWKELNEYCLFADFRFQLKVRLSKARTTSQLLQSFRHGQHKNYAVLSVVPLAIAATPWLERRSPTHPIQTELQLLISNLNTEGKSPKSPKSRSLSPPAELQINLK
jgi:hypothetical protein